MITKNSKNILVVDDSIFFRTTLKDILSEGGHMVLLSRDGKTAIEAIKADADDIDLLILDLKMPGIDGFGVLDWIDASGLRGKFPVLVMTGAYEPGPVLERLKGSAAMGLLPKGFSPQELIFRVNRLLFSDKAAEGVNPRERVPVSIPVSFTIEDTAERGFFINISEQGAFLNTRVYLYAGAALALEFSLLKIDRVFNLKAIVQWTTADLTSTTTFSGGGVMFTGVSSEEGRILRGFIADEIKRLGLHDYEMSPSVIKEPA
jgi:CheY-like chemotaxis protein